MTTTDAGDSSRPTLTASARCSRAIRTSSLCWVARIGKDSEMTPSSKRWSTVNPASVKTPIILRFCGSTSATNPVTPSSRPIAARCSSITEPTPRPWNSSETLNATSACGPSGPPMRSYRAMPTMRSAASMTSATRSW